MCQIIGPTQAATSHIAHLFSFPALPLLLLVTPNQPGPTFLPPQLLSPDQPQRPGNTVPTVPHILHDIQPGLPLPQGQAVLPRAKPVPVTSQDRAEMQAQGDTK